MNKKLLVPMAYADQLERELIQTEKERDTLRGLLSNTVYLSRYATISFGGNAGASEHWDKLIGEVDKELLQQAVKELPNT